MRQRLISLGISLFAATLTMLSGRLVNAETELALQLTDAETKLKAMSEFLEESESYKFKAYSVFDNSDRNHSQLKRFSTHTITIQHPNKLAFEASYDDGTFRQGWFDGKTLIVAFPKNRSYTKISFSGSIDELIEYLEDEFDYSLPISDLLYSNIYDRQAEYFFSSEDFGDRLLEEKKLAHLGFTNAAVDWQIWLEESPKPLPYQMLITYTRQLGDPEYLSTFSNWEINTAATEDFLPNIASDWTEIDFLEP